ncbi:MAG: biotin/lipoyl-binding protein, partial [Nitrospirota bacterium]
MVFSGTRPFRFAAALLVLAGIAGLQGCKQEAASTPARPIPEVSAVTVSPGTMPDEPEFIGQTEASRLVEIRSQVTGLLKERFFVEGRDVKKGDRLYQIDPIPFKAAMSSANARVAQADARLVQAKQNFARVKPLLAEQAVSQKDVDDAVAEE